jgi:hypothetical protein
VARTPAAAPKPKRRFGRKPKTTNGEPGQAAQIKAALAILRRQEPAALWRGAVLGIVVLAIFIGLGFALGHLILLPILGVLLGLMAAFVFLGRRAEKAVLSDVADRPGVALEVVRRMRGDWKITEAVQFTRNQDFVHRVVGRPGIILLAEGRPHAARELLRTESRRVRRVAPDAPIHEYVIGDDVQLAKLSTTLVKLPRTLKPAEVKTLNVKLKAVANTAVPLPKGPMPTRMPRGKIR